MFVQVIKGRVANAKELQAAIDEWYEEVAPDAIGWLGSTGGVTEDGTFIGVVRFESAEAAQRNSNRPEQDRWWTQTAKLFTGEPTFEESNDVVVDLVGDPNQAGFVQIMQGRGSDPDRARELMQQDSAGWAAFRPDLMGSVVASHEEGKYTMTMYFTSEAEAREGERKEPPPALKAQMDEMNALSIGTPEFFDLKEPWMHSPE